MAGLILLYPRPEEISPIAPEPILIQLEKPFQPPAPDLGDGGGSEAGAVEAETPAPEPQPEPEPPPQTPTRPVPVTASLNAEPSPRPSPPASVSAAELAGAAVAGSGSGMGSGGSGTGSGAGVGSGSGGGSGGGGECDMIARLQDKMRQSARVRAEVARVQAQVSPGRAPLLWNGAWLRSDGQDGEGLAAVRQAIAVEVAFAPAACRAPPMRGLVVLTMADQPGSPRIALGSANWRWSDLLEARRRN
ncbi:MAG: hypothetical protein ACK4I0_05285 [Brevundimonas sp.]|uniref:hypothetical protein n=1 Tax=Brevundimonas sp. TaxID=1871086 RepID=UPI0039190E7A